MYYNYCAAKNKLAKNDYSAYTNLAKCKGFKDTDTIISSNDIFKKIDFLQGKWHSIDLTYEEKLKIVKNSGEYWVIDNHCFLKTDYSFEEAKSLVNNNKGLIKGELLFMSSENGINYIEIEGTTLITDKGSELLEQKYDLTTKKIYDKIIINSDGSINLLASKPVWYGKLVWKK